MEEAFAAIQIEEEEQGGLCYENDSEQLSEIDTRWCLVGRFLTDSHIDFQAMQHKMASLWRPGRGLYVKQLDNNRFLFQFYHELDISRVIEGSPWSFGRFHLVMERLKEGDNPRTLEISKIDLWVQLHGMSPGFMSQRVAMDVGNYIGSYVDGDPNNFVGVWRDYLRIRVSLPLNSPIKRRMKLKKSENNWCWVNFQYEAIPTFCFICGMIGHGERFCDKIFDTPIESIEKPYGAWLRADPRRKTHTMGSKWLRSGGNFQATNSGENKDGDTDMGNPGKIAIVQQTGAKSGKVVNVELSMQRGNLGGTEGNIISNNLITSNQAGNQISNSNLEGDLMGQDISEINVIELKRRRVDFNPMNITQAQVSDMEVQNISEESKNELMAGAAVQTRQPL